MRVMPVALGLAIGLALYLPAAFASGAVRLVGWFALALLAVTVAAVVQERRRP